MMTYNIFHYTKRQEVTDTIFPNSFPKEEVAQSNSMVSSGSQ